MVGTIVGTQNHQIHIMSVLPYDFSNKQFTNHCHQIFQLLCEHKFLYDAEGEENFNPQPPSDYTATPTQKRKPLALNFMSFTLELDGRSKTY